MARVVMSGRGVIIRARWIRRISGKHYGIPNWTLCAQEWRPDAGSWRWSSAAVHCGQEAGNGLLALALWQRHWSNSAWREYLRAGVTESDMVSIRRCTYTGRPLGTAEFIKELEQKTRRRLALRKGGHPRKLSGDIRQGEMTFYG